MSTSLIRLRDLQGLVDVKTSPITPFFSRKLALLEGEVSSTLPIDQKVLGTVKNEKTSR